LQLAQYQQNRVDGETLWRCFTHPFAWFAMSLSTARQFVFIDANVTHAATLLAGIDPSYQVVWLTADRPALQ